MAATVEAQVEGLWWFDELSLPPMEEVQWELWQTYSKCVEICMLLQRRKDHHLDAELASWLDNGIAFDGCIYNKP